MQVLCYSLPNGCTGEAAGAADLAQAASNDFLLQVLDNALPQQLLEHLQQAFAPGAPFWREHKYGRVGYFSYFFRMVSQPFGMPCQLAVVHGGTAAYST